MKIVKLTFILLLYCGACMGQHVTNQISMNNIRTQSLCILEETDEKIIYLTDLVRIVQNMGDELKSYAGGDKLFFRYETWTILKDKENDAIHNRAILYSIPERIAMATGGSYDTAAFYLLMEIDMHYKNGKPDETAELPKEWNDVGLASDAGIYTKINSYFHENKVKIPVIQEDIEKSFRY